DAGASTRGAGVGEGRHAPAVGCGSKAATRPAFQPQAGRAWYAAGSGVEQSGCARRAHNPKAVGSNPTPATQPMSPVRLLGLPGRGLFAFSPRALAAAGTRKSPH